MSPSTRRLPFRYLEAAFFGGLLDAPLLFLRIRPLKRALLFDCGQIAHLAKRVVKLIDAVFITHAHMDHIMGLPTLVRHHDIYNELRPPQGTIILQLPKHLVPAPLTVNDVDAWMRIES